MQGTDYKIKSNTGLGQEQERFSHGHCSALLTLAGDRQILHPHQPIVPADAATGRQTHHAPQLTITAAGLTTPLIPILPPDSLTPPNPPEPSGRKEAKSGDSNMRLYNGLHATPLGQSETPLLFWGPGPHSRPLDPAWFPHRCSPPPQGWIPFLLPLRHNTQPRRGDYKTTRVRTHHQKRTVAARRMAERKTGAQRL